MLLKRKHVLLVNRFKFHRGDLRHNEFLSEWGWGRREILQRKRSFYKTNNVANRPTWRGVTGGVISRRGVGTTRVVLRPCFYADSSSAITRLRSSLPAFFIGRPLVTPCEHSAPVLTQRRGLLAGFLFSLHLKQCRHKIYFLNMYFLLYFN